MSSHQDEVFYRLFGMVLVALMAFTVVVMILARLVGGNNASGPMDPVSIEKRVKPTGVVNVAPPKADAPAAPAAQSAAPAPAAAAPAATAPATAPVAAAPAAAPAGSAPAAAGPDMALGEQVYNGLCAACHGAGVAGAPRVGDAAAWGPLAAKGLEALTASAISGKGAMPPRGGNPAFTDDQIRSAVALMLAKSK